MVEFELDKKSPVPFYRQICDMVLAGISTGKITPGDKLPTIRDLAVKLEVNPNTVVKAYSLLENLGTLDTQQGSGVFVRAQPVSSLTADDRRRAVETICRDFVGRAQVLGIQAAELLSYMQNMLASACGHETDKKNMITNIHNDETVERRP
jgi:GntR family transcriptional regulator